MVSFNTVPAGTRVPFFFVEFDASNANQGPAIQPYRILVIAQRMVGVGTVPELEPTLITNADQAGAAFGRGSIAHGMAIALFANNLITEAHFITQEDAGGSAAATGTITIAGTPTASGTIAFYVDGTRFTAGVTTASTPTTIAAAMAAAVNADTASPVTAAAALGVVTFTAKNKGTLGNSIDLRTNFNPGEETPAGLTSTVVAMGGVIAGATDPTITGALAVMGDTHYNVLAVGVNNQATITAVAAELATLYGPIEQRDGLACFGVRDTHSNLITLGGANNSKHIVIMGADESPSSPWAWAAGVAGIVAREGQVDPARPFQTLTLNGVLAPVSDKRFDWTERNLLLTGGIATFTVDRSGVVQLERLVSTFQTNASGAPDSAFADVQTFQTLAFLRFSLRTTFQTKFPRHKLADNGTNFGAGQAVLTPRGARAEILSLFRGWEEQGLVEGFEQFKTGLIVERNAQDPNRLDFLLPPDLVNSFIQGAASVQFRL